MIANIFTYLDSSDPTCKNEDELFQGNGFPHIPNGLNRSRY